MGKMTKLFTSSLVILLLVNNFHIITTKANFTTTPKLATGLNFSVALKSDGTVWTWGDNGNGKLGDGTTTDRTSPSIVPGLYDIVDIAASDDHVLALKSDGTVWAWGKNNSGQLGDGTKITKRIPTLVPNLFSVIDITAADNTSLALKSDGTVWAWGSNSNYKLGINQDSQTSSVQHPVLVHNLNNIIAISGGENNVAALKSDGTVWTWGSNSQGQLGNGSSGSSTSAKAPIQLSNISNVSQISVGNASMIALKNDGTLWHWGNCLTSGAYGSTCLSTSNQITQVPGINNVSKIDVGTNGVFAIKYDNTVWAWGNNLSGRSGTGSGSPQVQNPLPVVLSDFSTPLGGIINVSGSIYHGLAIKNDGTLWAWGRNSSGQLGIGSTVSPFNYAQQVPGFTFFNQDSINIGQTVNVEVAQGSTKKFIFRPTITGTVTIATGPWQVTSDTVLNLYDANNNLLATNDDYNNTTYSAIIYNVVAGQTYIIEVQGYQLSAVKCTLSIN